jgi:predicted nucleotide-binding protein (sugar kinase/HSP70/actin superfamily)
MAMSAAERQKKRRAKLKAESKKAIFVKGENGEFDERIRIALAVKSLSLDGRLPHSIIDLIVNESINVFETNEIYMKKYIRKIISEYLMEEKDNKHE